MWVVSHAANCPHDTPGRTEISSSPMSNSDGCDGCTRRTVIQGVVAASALVPLGCRLADPQTVGVQAPGDKLLVVRTTAADAFTTLSGVCTHAGCTVKYVTASTSLACPCHGSKFTIAGDVTNGPATRALRVFANAFDAATMTLTIT